jgi:HPt (histidine-containing phosphotransfer) domain-containing protein
MTAEPIVDPSVLVALTDDLGDEQVTISIVEAFLDELDGQSEQLALALAAGCGERARREAHTLAAPSATVGAVALAACCAAIERGETIVVGETTTERAASLRGLTVATRNELEAWLDRVGLATVAQD